MKRWLFWIGLLISAIFLLFALRGLKISEIWREIQSAEIYWLLPGIFVYFIAVWLRALRWKIFLKPMIGISTHKVFPIITIGYMGNNIYPARAGELLRAIVLKHKHNVPISASLATIIIERIFDGVVILGFILLNIPMIGISNSNGDISKMIQTTTLWGSILFFSSLGFFIVAAFYPKTIRDIFFATIGRLIPGRFQKKINAFLSKFLDGVSSLSSPLEVIYIFLITIMIWIIETSFYWIIMLAFPFQVDFFQLMFLNGVLNLFTSIPSSPGYVGTFDAPGISILNSLGVHPESSASYVLLLHAVLWLPITLVGGFFFGKVSIDWSNEINLARKERVL